MVNWKTARRQRNEAQTTTVKRDRVRDYDWSAAAATDGDGRCAVARERALRIQSVCQK